MASLCKMFNGLIWFLLNTFRTSLFATANLLSPANLESEANKLLNTFRDRISEASTILYEHTVDAQALAQSLDVTMSSFNLSITSNGSIQIQPVTLDNCSCVLNSQSCSKQAGLFIREASDQSLKFLSTPDGINVGCLPMLSLFHSTLACWYSEECYGKVIEVWRNRTTQLSFLPPSLDPTRPSRFNVSALVSTIVKEGMVERIDTAISYSSFIAACNPTYCTYTVKERRSIVALLTAVLVVFSGLNVAIKLLLVTVLPLVYRLRSGTRDNNRSFFQRCRHCLAALRGMNIFYSPRTSSALTLTNERRATLLYFLLLSTIFSVLIAYNALSETPISVTVLKPSQTVFEQLHASVGSSLRCPCSEISWRLESFVKVNLQFHRVCSSPFIEFEWIQSIFDDGDWSNIPLNEFYKRGSLYFITLRTFCLMAKKRMKDNIQLILRADTITQDVLSEAQLVSQVQPKLSFHINLGSLNFLSQLEMVADLAQTNQFLNIYTSNRVFLSAHSLDTSYSRIDTKPVSHGSHCSCATSSECTEPVFLDGQLVPGFVLGCSTIETSLRSRITCLYNDTCLRMINIANLSNYRPLTVDWFSRFSPDATVRELVEAMFLENWSMNISYTDYYKQCQPISCSYAVLQRPGAIEIITIILGIYGGLTVILRLIAPLLVNIISRLMAGITRWMHS